MRRVALDTEDLINELKNKITVMELWMEGHVVEFRNRFGPDRNWYTSCDPDIWEPAWDWDKVEYRIKKHEA